MPYMLWIHQRPTEGDWPGAHLHVHIAPLLRLDQLFDAPMPYMLWIHQRPTDGEEWPLAHVHLHIAPVLRQPGVLRFTAAGELGSGVSFNPVGAEAAAAMLRALPGRTR